MPIADSIDASSSSPTSAATTAAGQVGAAAAIPRTHGILSAGSMTHDSAVLHDSGPRPACTDLLHGDGADGNTDGDHSGYEEGDDYDDDDDDDDESAPPDLAAEAVALLARSDALLSRLAALSGAVKAAAPPDATPPGRPRTQSAVRSRRDRALFLEGLGKLTAMVKAERRFLAKLLNDPDHIQPSHVQCSNLAFLEAVQHLASLPDQAVCRIFHTVSYHPPASSNNSHRRHAAAVDTLNPASAARSLRIDLVGRNGSRWVKVKASALRGLAVELGADLDESDDDDDDDSDSSSGSISTLSDSNPSAAADIGSEDADADAALPSSLPVFAQARAWLAAAAQNAVSYAAPTVVFAFVLAPGDAVDPRIVAGLQDLGVVVEFYTAPHAATVTAASVTDAAVPLAAAAAVPLVGAARDSTETLGNGDSTSAPPPADAAASTAHAQQPLPALIDPSPAQALTDLLVLDTTCLIALVSDLSNRFHALPEHAFDTPALQVQRELEAAEPLFPTLLPHFHGRSLATPRTAFTRFAEILAVVAGPLERARALLLFPSEFAQTDPLLRRVVDSAADPLLMPLPDESAVRANSHPDLPFRRVAVVDDAPSPRFQPYAYPAAAAAAAAAASTHTSGNGTKPHAPTAAPAGNATAATSRLLTPPNAAVFGTADAMRATAVSANAGLARRLAKLAPGLPVLVHGARSLVEARPSYSVARRGRRDAGGTDGKKQSDSSGGAAAEAAAAGAAGAEPVSNNADVAPPLAPAS
ncbi:hypothetical protein HK405_007299 [Cladochytrium tenue]|nr:hypothetical protein HK405_007299 [Cladochytrium tenue]